MNFERKVDTRLDLFLLTSWGVKYKKRKDLNRIINILIDGNCTNNKINNLMNTINRIIENLE